MHWIRTSAPDFWWEAHSCQASFLLTVRNFHPLNPLCPLPVCQLLRCPCRQYCCLIRLLKSHKRHKRLLLPRPPHHWNIPYRFSPHRAPDTVLRWFPHTFLRHCWNQITAMQHFHQWPHRLCLNLLHQNSCRTTVSADEMWKNLLQHRMLSP